MEKGVRLAAIIVLLVIAVGLIGGIVYNLYPKKAEIVQQEVIEQTEPTAPVVEQPAKIESSKEVTVLISRFEFDKPEITIEPGTKVIWKNIDDRRHMITDQSGGFLRNLRKSLEYGDTFEYTFNEPGTYKILEANFGIHGTVIVKKQNNNMITGSTIFNLGLAEGNIALAAINIFVITMTLLVFGFYISRYKLQ